MIVVKCQWCRADKANQTKKLAHWELPDGRRAITITNIPSIHCSNCKMHYIADETVEKIEDQLLLIDTKKLSNSVSYDALMEIPRIIPKNYFK
ncbi:YokU family protein [Anaerobacillus sp. MEB173]|uniref:YokU family protein n=1 Tax=Anaerobacillus sp. MEB173 TaxID=3383345 RepID=UPI003F931F85